MLRRNFLFFILAMVFLLNGCQTASGVGKGVAYGVGGVACGIGSAAKGVGEDSVNLWNFIQATDEWIKENLW